MKYGVDKICKAQFQTPEPNILFTPFGQLSQDILFWSTMGISRSYNIFMGLMEVIPALLLLHKKTRFLGLLIAIGVLIHIIAINFSFDISVKIYSIFLFVLACICISPYLNSFKEFIFSGKATSFFQEKKLESFSPSFTFGLKIFAIGFIFLESLFPYIQQWNFKNDNSPRPFLHGAYEVVSFRNTNNNEEESTIPFKRFFIHKNGYIIFQSETDEMKDYKLKIDQQKEEIIVIDYKEDQGKHFIFPFQLNLKDSIISLQYQPQKIMTCKVLDWKKMPALQNEFHWVIEEIK